jgi:hypothetical protein
LSLVGGYDLKGITNNIMKELVLDELAKTINPTGSRNKVSFKQFKLLNQVITSKLA